MTKVTSTKRRSFLLISLTGQSQGKRLGFHRNILEMAMRPRFLYRWPTVDIIAALEADPGKPVVAAAAAMVWGRPARHEDHGLPVRIRKADGLFTRRKF
jgi:hypothetical protein